MRGDTFIYQANMPNKFCFFLLITNYGSYIPHTEVCFVFNCSEIFSLPFILLFTLMNNWLHRARFIFNCAGFFCCFCFLTFGRISCGILVVLNVLISLFAYSLMVASILVFPRCWDFLCSLGCSSQCSYGLIACPSPTKSEQNQPLSEVMLQREDNSID